MSESFDKQYDIVLFGASGYTGKWTAEYIAKNLPTDIRWAVAGRSRNKLEAVVKECKSIDSDRIQPAIEIVELSGVSLEVLVKKTKLLISTVGPFSLYGEYAFKACASTGTHYIDATGETAFVADMIKKYEKVAQASGAIMIPEIGFDSAPADLVAWCLVSMIRERFSAPTKDAIVSVHDIRFELSGGTLNTIFTMMDTYSPKQLREAGAPYALSPIPRQSENKSKLWFMQFFGIRVIPDLGVLTTWLGSPADTAIVHRSWGLLGGNNFYGPKFQFGEYIKARNYILAVLTNVGIMTGMILLALPFVRSFVRRFIYQPGDGPSRSTADKQHFELRGIGQPDVQSANPARAFCRASFNGSVYKFTALSLSQAAISILRDDHRLSGGIYTPACLGQPFLDRLETFGFKVEKKFLVN